MGTAAVYVQNRLKILQTLRNISGASKEFDAIKKEIFYKGHEKDPRYLDDPTYLKQVHCLMGIVSELNELFTIKNDEIKISKNIVEECGDLLFYIQGLLNTVDVDIRDALEANVRKLDQRYKKKTFSTKEALNRNLTKEKAALDGLPIQEKPVQ